MSGEQVGKVAIDVGSAEHWAPGLIYVAVSRGKVSSCIAFNPMPTFERFSKLNTSLRAKNIFARLADLGEMSKRDKH